MNEFSFRGAWSKGLGFLSGKAAGHAAILVLLGILAPFALQYALIGEAAGLANPAMMAAAGGGAAITGGIAAIAFALGYVVQTGSYFGSWRLGLAEGENVAGALIYGLLAGLLVVVGAGLIMILIGVTFMTALPPVGIVLIVIAFLLLFAMLYTVVAALIGVAVFLVFVLALILGVSTGQVGAAATLAGGRGDIAVVLILASVVMLWLSARLSCATSIMADRRSFNPFAAIAESWRLTAYDQFRIMGYLALVGLALTITFVVAAAAAGMAFAAALEAGAPSGLGLGAAILGLIVAIPVAYLTVLVPGGIYRDMTGSTFSAEVFA